MYLERIELAGSASGRDRTGDLRVMKPRSNRPVFAPETPEQNVSKRGERDKRPLSSLAFSAGGVRPALSAAGGRV
jgi:hypothetical protein